MGLLYLNLFLSFVSHSESYTGALSVFLKYDKQMNNLIQAADHHTTFLLKLEILSDSAVHS